MHWGILHSFGIPAVRTGVRSRITKNSGKGRLAHFLRCGLRYRAWSSAMISTTSRRKGYKLKSRELSGKQKWFNFHRQQDIFSEISKISRVILTFWSIIRFSQNDRFVQKLLSYPNPEQVKRFKSSCYFYTTLFIHYRRKKKDKM